MGHKNRAVAIKGWAFFLGTKPQSLLPQKMRTLMMFPIKISSSPSDFFPRWASSSIFGGAEWGQFMGGGGEMSRRKEKKKFVSSSKGEIVKGAKPKDFFLQRAETGGGGGAFEGVDTNAVDV